MSKRDILFWHHTTIRYRVIIAHPPAVNCEPSAVTKSFPTGSLLRAAYNQLPTEPGMRSEVVVS